jgi:uncharacterized protein
MRHLTILVLSLIVSLSISIVLSVHASAQEYSIPNWVKNMTKWWSQGQTSDSDFIKAMQYLIDNNILHPASQKTPYKFNVTSNPTDLQNQDDQLSQRLNELQSQYDTLQARYNLLLQQVRNTTTQSITSVNNIDTISAVAVTPVIESDGFFESTKYQGSILKITVEIRDGTGLVLVNTAIPSGVDFQTSARTSVTVAQNVTRVDLSKKDIIFSISTGNNQDLQAVDGGSAGGAMTVLLVSDLLGKSINNQVLMTGTIQSDGTIGPIGAVSEKADAAGKFGAKIFLVPEGQAVIPVQTCSQKTEGPFVYQTCTTQQAPLSPMMESKYGMKVVEVNTIQDVLKYFDST